MERRHPYHVLCGPVHGGHRDYERASEGATLLHDAQWLVPQARGSATPSREPWRVDGRGGGIAGLASGAGGEGSGSAVGNPRVLAVPGLGSVEYDLATDLTELRSLVHRFVHTRALTSGSGCVDDAACVEAKCFATLCGTVLEQCEKHYDESGGAPPKVTDAGGYSFSGYYGHRRLQSFQLETGPRQLAAAAPPGSSIGY